MVSVLMLLLAVAAVPEVAPPPRPVLTAAQSVRELSRAAAARKLPVRLTGVVTHVNPHVGDFFLQDGSAGIYVMATALVRPTQGDVVELIGVSNPGLFAPCVDPTAARVVGRGRLPDPLPFDLSAEDARWLDGQYVCVAASVRSVSVGAASGFVDVRVGVDGKTGLALVPGADALARLRELVGKPVRLYGVCVPLFDAHGAVSGPPRLFVQSADRITVYAPPRGNRPVEPAPVAELRRRFSPDPHPALRTGAVTGVVVGRTASALLLQDDTGGVAVEPAAGGVDGYRVGDRVTARGALRIAGRQVALDRADVAVTARGDPPEPRDWSAAQLAAGETHGLLGRFTGEVVDVADGPGRPLVAALRDGAGLIEVVLPADFPAGRLPVGATVAVTGVPAVVPGHGAGSDGWAVVTRSADDVRVVALPPPPPAAPWWTPWRTAGVAAGAVAAAALAVAWVVLLRRTVRHQTEQIRRQLLVEQHLEAGYRDLFDSAGDAVWVTGPDGRLTDLNRAAEKLIGLPKAEAVGRSMADFLTDSQAGLARSSFVAKADAPFELTVRPATGPAVAVEVSSRLLPGGGVQTTARDLTERKKLQERAQRVQKLEAVGRLAGGLAHDFNNLLTVISGNAELAVDQLPIGHPVRQLTSEILAAGTRAAGLTRQLLAFSRQRFVQFSRVDLNQVVADAAPLFRRLVGAKVRLAVVLPEDVPAVTADAGMVEQVLMNLVVNARDAMPAGGTITLTTSRTPAGWARLTVADTGTGMDEATQARVFEPFFTTKEVGQGTGLGLATVYGIVQTLGGTIRFTSAVGAGTTFEVELPPSALDPTRTPTPARTPTGRPTVVLLVEDDPSVRAFAVGVLEAAGLTVLAAEDGADALRLLAAHPGPVDVLLTDVLMPGMTGREVAAAVRAARPGVRVLYMSGYPGDTGPAEPDGFEFVPKPFHPAELLARVRAAADPQTI